VLGLSREVIDRLEMSGGKLRIGKGEERYLILPARFFGAVYESVRRLVGSGVSGLLYYVGKEVGKGLLEEIRYRLETKGITGPEGTARELFSFLSDLGFGKVELVSISEGEAVVRIHESPTSSTLSKCEGPSCHLERGLLAGAAEAFFNVRCVAKEVKCRCLGHPYCEFVISWGSE